MIGNEVAPGGDAEAARARVEALSERLQESTAELREFADQLRRRASRSKSGEDAELFLDAARALSAADLTHLDLVTITRTLALKDIPHADSFWHSILTRRRKKQLGRLPERQLGLNKQKDEAFAHTAGVATVNTLFRGGFDDVPRDIAPTVLKPVKSSGSRGAYYILEDEIRSISSSTTIRDWGELQNAAMRELKVSTLADIEWEMQDLVTFRGQPAPDLKFYCFYGEVGTVLEVSRHPVLQYAYFDGALQLIDFRTDEKPVFDDVSATSVQMGGLDEEKMETARNLSLEIPVPFMRIDFLGSDSELVFCEFSSAPGMSHALTKTHDARLGRMYHEAEIRLVNDLFEGKPFETFKRYVAQVPK